MHISRRRFALTAASVAALPAATSKMWAQAWPARPVRLIVPNAAGAAPDIIARLLAQSLSERFKQQFVVDNRPGASGNIATDVVVRAAPDGYTLLMVGLSNAINASLFEKLNYDFLADIAPIASINRTPTILELNNEVPARTVAELIAYAKANPGKMNVASPGGTAGLPQLAAELFKMLAGVDLVQVPFRGTPEAQIELIAGRVQIFFDPVPSAIEHVKAGRMRPLATTSAQRLDILPDVPALAEFLPGYEVAGFLGIGAPKNTNPEIIKRLNSEINMSLADPALRARIAGFGSVIVSGSSEEFGKFVASETERWSKVIKLAGLKPD